MRSLRIGAAAPPTVIPGGPGDDVLEGADGHDQISGLGGDDRLSGRAGDDLLDGGADDDVLDGGSGADTLYAGDGEDLLRGGSGDDVLSGGAGPDTIQGGGGFDTVSYQGSAKAVFIVLDSSTYTQSVSGGDAAGDRLRSIEGVIGSEGNDYIYGSDGINSLSGSGGDDFLMGLDGPDRLNGGLGVDTAIYSLSDSRVLIRLWNGTGEGGEARGDRLASIENVVGSAHNDLLIGNDFRNLLVGSGGNDYLEGLGGRDTLVGGSGNEIFAFRSALGPDNIDVIEDFSSDTIYLDDAIFAALNGAGALAPNLFKDTAKGPIDADDRIIYNSATGALIYDVNGSDNGGATQFATLRSSPTLTADSFLVI